MREIVVEGYIYFKLKPTKALLLRFPPPHRPQYILNKILREVRTINSISFLTAINENKLTRCRNYGSFFFHSKPLNTFFCGKSCLSHYKVL